MGCRVGEDRVAEASMLPHEDLNFINPPMIEIRVAIGQEEKAIVLVCEMLRNGDFEVLGNCLVSNRF